MDLNIKDQCLVRVQIEIIYDGLSKVLINIVKCEGHILSRSIINGSGCAFRNSQKN